MARDTARDSGARSAQRSRASRSRRAASSFSSTVATSALTASGRWPAQQRRRAGRYECHHALDAAARRRPGALIRQPASSASTATGSSRSIRSFGLDLAPDRRPGWSSIHSTGSDPPSVLPELARPPTVSSETRSDDDSASCATISVCSIVSRSVGAGSSGSTGGGGVTKRDQVQVEPRRGAGRRPGGRRSPESSIVSS